MLKDIRRYFANFDGATNSCRTIALWISIALVLAFAVTKIYMYVLPKISKKHTSESISEANKILNGIWIIIALFFAVLFIVTFATCYFVEIADEEETLVPILFYPLLILAIAIVASAGAIAFKPLKLTKIICASVCAAAIIAVVVCMIVHYASDDTDKAFSSLGLYLSAGALIIGIILLTFFADRKSQPFNARSIAFAAVCVALSFALSYVRLFRMPMGGSITFASMLPLMFYSYMFGCRKGILAGLVLGLLQAIQDAWIIHPAQFALDYAIAYSAIGLTGCIRNFNLFSGKMRTQFTLGAVIAGAIRFISHYFAGVFAFGSYGAYYAEEYGIAILTNEYFYSFLYQVMYIIPEMMIVTVVGVLLLTSNNFRKQVERYSDFKAFAEQTLSNSNETVLPKPEEHTYEEDK